MVAATYSSAPLTATASFQLLWQSAHLLTKDKQSQLLNIQHIYKLISYLNKCNINTKLIFRHFKNMKPKDASKYPQ